MRVLIDTHVLIWHVEDDIRLPQGHSEIIADPTNQIWISIASIWEIAIKISIGKLALSRPIDDVLDEIEQSTISVLGINPGHAVRVSQLPFHHRDPFDRMIIAQSQVESLNVLTNDEIFASYGVTVL